MDDTAFTNFDYNSQEGPPLRSALGETPLSPFASAMAFLIGLGVIMAGVTLFIARAN